MKEEYVIGGLVTLLVVLVLFVTGSCVEYSGHKRAVQEIQADAVKFGIAPDVQLKLGLLEPKGAE